MAQIASLQFHPDAFFPNRKTRVRCAANVTDSRFTIGVNLFEEIRESVASGVLVSPIVKRESVAPSKK